MTFFDQVQAGELLSKITTDCTLVSDIYFSKGTSASEAIGQVISTIILSFIVSWQITLACIGCYILTYLIYFITSKFSNKYWPLYTKATSDANTKAEEIITSFKTVKAFNNELYELQKYRSSLENETSVFNSVGLVSSIKDGLVHLIMYLMVTLILYFSCWVIQEKPDWKLESGDIIILIMCANCAALAISLAITTSEEFKKANSSANNILKAMEINAETNSSQGEDPPNAVQGKIEFKDVMFKYKTRDTYASNHMSFVVNKGETVALVGESGCGKTTVLQLLQRFYEIESGEILIDDVNIKNWSPQYLRAQIAVVSQNPVLFSMTIKDNIRFSKANADDSEVMEAARIGNAHDFIMALPDNYDSEVQTSTLSGGQKQRICISRAILENAPILLLDEATAALDTESERLVQESLEQVRKDKTAIIVAHRLATVVNADKILVIKDGHVIESGSHTELLEKKGYYSQLVKFQLQ